MGILRDPRSIPNKQKRSEQLLKLKKIKESTKRDERLRRRRTEDKNPRLREERRAKNVPATIESKRTWDEAEGGDDLNLGLSVDLQSIKRRKVEDVPGEIEEDVAPAARKDNAGEEDEFDEEVAQGEEDGDKDSMLDSDSEAEADEEEDGGIDGKSNGTTPADRVPSPAPSAAPSTSTDLNITPESLQSRFPTLFEPLEHPPKILITTSINSTLKAQAQTLTGFFPNSSFIPRNTHFHSHKYSIREITKFASNREFTTLIILNEDLKKPSGLDVVHLPSGPMFHFSISNWIDASRLPGHGNPTGHDPELILNGFRTPLGLLTAHLFRTMFPPVPQLVGRTVVTLHNQRDYVFVRRHRYIFRNKRATEKVVVGPDGKPVKGVEDVRTGLQELGPRFTLKLRRIDRGVQRASGQEWEWKGKSEKVRTRFAL